MGGVAAFDDHLVAVEDAGVDHGVALHLEDEVLPGAQHGFGHRHAVAFVLDGVDRRAGGDAAQHRQFAHLAGRRGGVGHAHAFHHLGPERGAALGRRGGGGLLRHLDHLQRPGPVRQAAQEAPLLQRRDQAVDAGLGGQVQGFLHLVEGRGDAGLLEPLVDEHQQFVLFAREHET